MSRLKAKMTEDKAQMDIEYILVSQISNYLAYIIETKQCSRFMDWKRQKQKDREEE